MKKFTQDDIWDMFQVAKKIIITYDCSDALSEDAPITDIRIYIQDETIEDWIASFNSSVLDIDTFPKRPKGQDELMIERPFNIRDYIGKLCAFWNTDDEFNMGKFVFDNLSAIDFEGDYYTENHKITPLGFSNDFYKNCMPAEKALKLIRKKIKAINKTEE